MSSIINQLSTSLITFLLRSSSECLAILFLVCLVYCIRLASNQEHFHPANQYENIIPRPQSPSAVLAPVRPLKLRTSTTPSHLEKCREPITVSSGVIGMGNSVENALSIQPFPKVERNIPLESGLDNFSTQDYSPRGSRSHCLIASFEKLSLKELSPRVTKKVRPALSCQKTESAQHLVGKVDNSKTTSVNNSVPRRLRNKTPLRRSNKRNLLTEHIELSPAHSSVLPDAFLSKFNQISITEPTLRSCFRKPGAPSLPKKSVQFPTLEEFPNVVYSEYREYELDLAPGQPFPYMPEEMRANELQARHLPHAYGRTEIRHSPLDGKMYLLKELGVFYSPAKDLQMFRPQCSRVRKGKHCHLCNRLRCEDNNML